MQQTRLSSFIEALFNIVIGYWIALVSQLVLFPIYDIHVDMSTNILIGAWFTLISLVRSYVIRRWFNARLHRAAQKVASSL